MRWTYFRKNIANTFFANIALISVSIIYMLKIFFQIYNKNMELQRTSGNDGNVNKY